MTGAVGALGYSTEGEGPRPADGLLRITLRGSQISATGWGEYFIRTGVAQDIHGRMLHGNSSLGEACRETIFDEMGALGGDGGVVAVDALGKIALVCNSAGMFRAWAHPEGHGVAMFGATLEGTVEIY